MPLGRLLGLIVLVTALPLLLATYVSYQRLAANEGRSIEQSLLLSTKILAGLVDNEIDEHGAVLKTLAQSRALSRGDLAAFWQEAHRAMDVVPGSWLSVNDAQGQLLMSTLVPFGSSLPQRAAADLLRAPTAKDGVVSDLRQSALADKLSAYIDLPIFEGSSPKYILSISLPPEQFYELVKDRFSRGELVGILDRKSRFIARIPDNEARVGAFASEGWRAGIAKAAEGFTYNRSLEGNLVINAYTTSARGWVVGVGQPEAQLLGPQRSVLESTAWVVGLLTAISLTLAILMARHASRGMEQLAAAATNVGEGRPIPEIVAPFREAAAITAALRTASEEVAHAQADLEVKVMERTQELSAEMRRREQSEAQARQLLRMQAIGQLTGGIAHDFNNMLAIVISSLNLLKRRLAAGRSDVDELIAGGIDGAQRAASLTQRLLAFARQQPLSPEALDVNRLINGLGDLIYRTIGEDIRVETVLAAGLWTVHADASQLENAILNLAVNARDAMADGGKLTIETSNSYLDEDYAQQHEDVTSGQFVLIAVTDTGSGMATEAVARAFEPFYTTKAPGRGTGLGLAQVYGFVKQSRGHSKIYSEVGHGTTVKLYLPRYVGGAEPAIARATNAATVERGSAEECVLVVEDETRVRQLSAETLRELGYRVLEADGAAAALKHIESDRAIKLLFTDIVMPDVNGRKLADQALSLNPNLKVLFTTGFTRNAVIHHGTLDPGVNFIAKPFTIEALARKIRQVLDS
jgi:signal transduction histidine kinase